MAQSVFLVVVTALLGALTGITFYHLQPPHLSGMNELGVLAFTSLGACVGCLMAEPRDRFGL